MVAKEVPNVERPSGTLNAHRSAHTAMAGTTKTTPRTPLITAVTTALLFVAGALASPAPVKEKVPPVSPDDVTLRLYQLLDSAYEGKLLDFYLIADTFKDPQSAGQEHQHILKVEYEKARGFGKLRIHVRMVDKLTPEQLKAYTTKQIFEFAEVDSEKFTKTDPGSFGRPGDVYFRAVTEGGPLASVPPTDDTRVAYERYLTECLLPALQKK